MLAKPSGSLRSVSNANASSSQILLAHFFLMEVSFCNCQVLYLWGRQNLFLRFYLFIFRERGREGKRGRQTYIYQLPLTRPLLATWPATQACALTGNRTSDLSQSSTQSTEPHQPRQNLLIFFVCISHTHIHTLFPSSCKAENIFSFVFIFALPLNAD